MADKLATNGLSKRLADLNLQIPEGQPCHFVATKTAKDLIAL